MVLVVGLLAATALLSAQLAAYVGFRSHGSRDAVLMALTMAATAWWSAGNAAEDLAVGLAAKLVFANLEYLGITTIPVLWFALGWSLDRQERTDAPGKLSPAFWILPAVTSVLVWTDPVFGLVRHSFRLESAFGLAYIAKSFGPWFWVHSAYSYVLVMAGTVLLLRAVSAGRGTRRVQNVILIIGSVLPVAVNVLYITNLIPSGSVDPTPLAFSATGLLLVFNLSRFRFLSLMTAAQGAAIEQLRDPVLILDRDGRLAYVNAAARVSFETGPGDIGRPLGELGPPYSTLPRACDEVADAAREDALLPFHGRRYEMRTGSILRRARCLGSVVTFFDVTLRVAAEEELRKSNVLLEQHIAERTQALQQSNARLTEELEQRRRAEKQLAHDVLHDPLTGLPNRSLASSRIEQLIMRMRRDSTLSYAVLFMDFDGFKTINDTSGHAAGDSFLSQMAARLSSSVREMDLAARVGGDQFVVMLDGPGGPSSLDRIAERIQDHVCIPVSLGGGTVVPSVSIGIAVGSPAYKDPESLLHDAEIAMQQAKSAGRNLRVTFSEEMRQQADEQVVISSALRTAIATGGITLAYQPIVTLGGNPVAGARGSVQGWEVLARWRHERLGYVGPDRFISIAEESGLITPLGAYILIEALRTAAGLRDQGLLSEDGRVVPFFSVNVSAIQLGQPDFSELVLSSVDRMGLPRSLLHLELTESAIMKNRDVATRVIQHLSREGISFKLDDFGTGYSSLGYLHAIPIDCVKI
ncbi:MAG TPA: histidine kinase N-terminal 7TM domain-containing protein, partial [Spirochaetia bacterium]|nr:histidine kinase N-terminal 7TM domain-containing protein [Spirochaetia bacterium]